MGQLKSKIRKHTPRIHDSMEDNESINAKLPKTNTEEDGIVGEDIEKVFNDLYGSRETHKSSCSDTSSNKNELKDGIVGDDIGKLFNELYESWETHNSSCCKNGLCECVQAKLEKIKKRLEDCKEPRLVDIFKNYVQPYVKSRRIKNELVSQFQTLCFAEGYAELAESVFSNNVPHEKLESELEDKFLVMSDKFMAFIISKMNSDKVQSFFSSTDRRGHEKLEIIIKDRHMALQKLLEKLEIQRGQNVYVNCKILEMDDSYRTPKSAGKDFNFLYQTVYQKIAYEGLEDALCHKCFYQLTNEKWEKWCKHAFTIDAIIYLVSVVLLTIAAVAGVNATDVVKYQSPIDYVRAVFEIILTLNAARILGIEIYQVTRLKKEYLLDKMNYFEIVAPMLIFLVLTLRYIHEQAHWYIYSAAYLVWLLQIVKFAPVFQFTGVYVDSLRIMIVDILKFAILFVISIIIFSGTFLLVLKAENTLDKHQETKSFWSIFLVGLRVMIESDSIIEYTGDDGYKAAGVMAMMFFMFFIIVVLLNMLIAQLINTYQKFERSSLKGFKVRRAKIVARLEREQLPFIFNNDGKRREHYEEELEINDDLARVPDTGILYEDQIIQLQHIRRDEQSISKKMNTTDSIIDTVITQLSIHKQELEKMSKLRHDDMMKVIKELEKIKTEVQNAYSDKKIQKDASEEKKRNIMFDTELQELHLTQQKLNKLNETQSYQNQSTGEIKRKQTHESSICIIM